MSLNINVYLSLKIPSDYFYYDCTYKKFYESLLISCPESTTLDSFLTENKSKFRKSIKNWKPIKEGVLVITSKFFYDIELNSNLELDHKLELRNDDILKIVIKCMYNPKRKIEIYEIIDTNIEDQEQSESESEDRKGKCLIS